MQQHRGEQPHRESEPQITETGEGNRRVVFVHGVLDCGQAFDRVATRLGRECHMLWYDRRGYGTSTGLAKTPATIDVHIDDLLTILDGRHATLVGHSFGGVVALGAAAAAPDLVQSVALYETNIAWVPGWDDGAMRAVHAHADPEDAALQLMLGPGYARMTDHDRARRRAEARAFLAEEQSVREAVPYDVRRIAAPVLYGQGADIVMPMVVDFLATNIAKFELVSIPGATHHAHRSRPDEFASLVRRAIAMTGGDES
jgi:pimeloyl-ACP methyl ester carboxylesterase